MDEHLAEIIVVLITGIFSVITLLVNGRQDKIVKSIDKKTVFMEKERALRKKIDVLSREREMIIHNMMVLILDSNIELMKSIDNSNEVAVHNQLYENANTLKDLFNKTNEQLEEINKEYQIVMDMAKEAQAEIDKLQKKK